MSKEIINRFNPGDVVRHFKRELLTNDKRLSNMYLYKIIGEAQHTETGEKLMIYMALYDDFRVSKFRYRKYQCRKYFHFIKYFDTNKWTNS